MTYEGLVFDTFAWVEYIADGKHAKKVSDLLVDTGHRQKITPATVMAELTEKLLREGADQLKIKQAVEFIASKTMIVQCDEQIACRAGEINHAQKQKIKDWGMLDSLNYAVAKILNCQFVTGDPHFRGFKDVIWLD